MRLHAGGVPAVDCSPKSGNARREHDFPLTTVESLVPIRGLTRKHPNEICGVDALNAFRFTSRNMNLYGSDAYPASSMERRGYPAGYSPNRTLVALLDALGAQVRR